MKRQPIPRLRRSWLNNFRSFLLLYRTLFVLFPDLAVLRIQDASYFSLGVEAKLCSLAAVTPPSRDATHPAVIVRVWIRVSTGTIPWWRKKGVGAGALEGHHAGKTSIVRFRVTPLLEPAKGGSQIHL
eukprot:906599-Amorphochlora_amoeboformis.AAC.2